MVSSPSVDGKVEVRFNIFATNHHDVVIRAPPTTQFKKVFQIIADKCAIPVSVLRFVDQTYIGEDETIGEFVKRSDGYAQIDVLKEQVGGKGGFGSMLRTIGAQIEKTTNREACRDLSGRRMRDVARERRVKQAAVKKAKNKIETLAKKKEIAKKKLENLMNQPGSSKASIITEDLIVTDIAEKVDEDLTYFQERQKQKNLEQVASSSASSSGSSSNSASSSSKSIVLLPKTTNSKPSNESSDDSDDDDDAALGKNFWSGIN